MQRKQRAAAIGVLGVVLACDPAPQAPVALLETTLAPALAVSGAATGGGHYDIAGLIVQFSFSAVQYADGSASGAFHHQTSFDGLTAELYGRVTCLAVDPDNHRAWIGGVITKNSSTDPDLGAAIHQPGRDIWFRVVDYGSGGGAPSDRTTFTGFEGSGGIITSAEYCAARIWPDGDARTWPVTGNVTVTP